jgi:DNA-binding CsgD family transcriptional regulator
MQRDSLKQRLLARRNPNQKAHKLSRSQVYEILRRFADGETQVALAEEFGVSHQVVSYHVRKACEE